MESTFSRNRKLEASLAYNRKICGRSSIQTNEAACYAIAMVRVYMIQGKFVNNMCNVESLKMQGNHWEEVLKKEMESHWKMRLHVFTELSAKKTAISSAIPRRAMWQGLLWQKRKKKLMAVATQQSHHGSVSPRIIGSTALSDQSYLLWLPYSSTREHLKPFYSFTRSHTRTKVSDHTSVASVASLLKNRSNQKPL